MLPADETFDDTWPFKPRFSEAAGFRQHYVDEGPRNGEIVICLHGEPTWGYLYRNFTSALARHYRVIVPDHMGFGKSETPQDWGGPMTGAYTIRDPGRVKRLALMNTLLGYGGPTSQSGALALFQVDSETP